MKDFKESEHPRDSDGKFTYKESDIKAMSTKELKEVLQQELPSRNSYADLGKLIQWAKENGIELSLNKDGSLDDTRLQKLYEKYNSDVPSPKGKNKSHDEFFGEEFKGVKGQAAVEKLLKEKRGHVKGAFHRDDIGEIDLLWGDDNVGLKHIIKQREKQGIDSNEFVRNLSTVIEKGDFYQKSDRGNFEILYNGKMAIIAPEYHGNKVTFLLTAYKTRYKK